MILVYRQVVPHQFFFYPPSTIFSTTRLYINAGPTKMCGKKVFEQHVAVFQDHRIIVLSLQNLAKPYFCSVVVDRYTLHTLPMGA